MTNYTSRRNWLKSTALLASGMAIQPYWASAKGHPYSVKNRMIDHTLPLIPQINQVPLKARLLANENPYGPCEAAREAVVQSVSRGNRYSWEEFQKLTALLAEKEGVSPKHILIGPGSTDLLEKTALVNCKPGSNIVSALPTFMTIVRTAQAIGAEWRSISVKTDHSHDLTAMEKAIDQNTRMVYICNPNNPIGTITPAQEIRSFCLRVSSQVPVFLDEAYNEFLEQDYSSSMIDLVRDGKDVMVARTFSKIYGMAGLRIGYLVGQPDRLDQIREKVRNSMALSVTSLMAAQASLQEDEFVRQCRQKNKEAREYVYSQLNKLSMEYIPSHTSFIIFPINMPPKKMQERMLAQGVGIRMYTIDEKPWCRVSMGTMAEMELFSKALKKVIA